VPNFKLWHDPDPTNYTTKGKELLSANSLTLKKHFGNDQGLRVERISNDRLVLRVTASDPNGQGPATSARMKADRAQRRAGAEKLRSEVVLEILDPLTSLIFANRERNHMERARIGRIAAVTDPLGRVVRTKLFVPDRKAHPGFQSLQEQGEIPIALMTTRRHLVKRENDLFTHGPEDLHPGEALAPIMIEIRTIAKSAEKSLLEKQEIMDRPVFQKNRVPEAMPIPEVPMAIATKNHSRKKSKNHLFRQGLLSQEILPKPFAPKNSKRTMASPASTNTSPTAG